MDYIYVGSGLRHDIKEPATTPLAYEFPDNHPEGLRSTFFLSTVMSKDFREMIGKKSLA
jgi:hypothetical protein